jgi:hypothetical protein
LSKDAFYSFLERRSALSLVGTISSFWRLPDGIRLPEGSLLPEGTLYCGNSLGERTVAGAITSAGTLDGTLAEPRLCRFGFYVVNFL